MAKTKNIYALPFEKNNAILAVSDPRAHFAHFEHAVDFILPEGTKILAPYAGIVLEAKTDSNEGGADPKYNDIKYVNYITLKHSNGEFSLCAHLKHNGALVKAGDMVKTRQPIALSGNTGFTTVPHLHFHVAKLAKTKTGWETLDIRFNETVRIDRTKRPISKRFNKTLKELERVKKSLIKDK